MAQYRKFKRKGRFRSNFELKVSKQIIEAGAQWKYEWKKFVYYQVQRNIVICENCGPVKALVRREYLPDFFLSNGVVIEAKGRFTSEDRAKLIAVKKYHPDLDLRVFFQYNGKLRKTSEDRYMDWANKNGFPAAVGVIPKEWFLHADQKWPRNWQAKYGGLGEVLPPKKVTRRI